jgi:hypothetical protein
LDRRCSRSGGAPATGAWAIDVLPGEYNDQVFYLRMVLMRDMGVTLGEILDFDELADDCAADGVWELFFCAPPLKVTARSIARSRRRRPLRPAARRTPRRTRRRSRLPYS